MSRLTDLSKLVTSVEGGGLIVVLSFIRDDDDVSFAALSSQASAILWSAHGSSSLMFLYSLNRVITINSDKAHRIERVAT